MFTSGCSVETLFLQSAFDIEVLSILSVVSSEWYLSHGMCSPAGISAPAAPGGPMIQQSGLKISTDLILRVQVVYVLGLFLVGKHRKKVGLSVVLFAPFSTVPAPWCRYVRTC